MWSNGTRNSRNQENPVAKKVKNAILTLVALNYNILLISICKYCSLIRWWLFIKQFRYFFLSTVLFRMWSLLVPSIFHDMLDKCLLPTLIVLLLLAVLVFYIPISLRPMIFFQKCTANCVTAFSEFTLNLSFVANNKHRIWPISVISLILFFFTDVY